MNQHKSPRRLFARGFTITELMIALVLSIFLVGGVLSVYVANVRTSQVNDMMSQAQQSSQISFQLLTRDIQHAGFSGCGNMISERVVNALEDTSLPWWAYWNNLDEPLNPIFYAGLQGYESSKIALPPFGGSEVTAVATADAIRIMYGRNVSVSVVSHTLTAKPHLVINENKAGIVANDIVIGCDAKMAAIFQITSVVGNELNHDVNIGIPGNADNNFGFGVNGGARVPQTLTPDAGMLIPLESMAWFVGSEGGKKSLYRVALVGGQMYNELILSGVDDMELQYLQLGHANYVDAHEVASWQDVTAVRVTIVLQDHAQTPMPAAMRTITQVINLRNH